MPVMMAILLEKVVVPSHQKRKLAFFGWPSHLTFRYVRVASHLSLIGEEEEAKLHSRLCHPEGKLHFLLLLPSEISPDKLHILRQSGHDELGEDDAGQGEPLTGQGRRPCMVGADFLELCQKHGSIRVRRSAFSLHGKSPPRNLHRSM